jgi:hypothetical protein
MNFFLLGKIDRRKADISLISIIILLFIFRTANPLFKYPFLILYFFLVISFLLYHKNYIFSELKKFISSYFIILFLLIILLSAFLFSNKLYLTIFKDGFSALVLLSLFYMLSFLISSKEEFKYFLDDILRLIVFFAFIIALCNLLDLFDIISLHKYIFTNDISGNYPSYSEFLDYNFALLPVLFGMIIVFYFLSKTSSNLKKIIFLLLLIIFLLNIFLSGSKRGAIILIGIFFILATAEFIYIFKKNQFLNNLSINFRYLFISFCFLSVLTYIFIFLCSPTFKSKTLQLIGSKNILTARIKIASSVIRYASIFDKEIMYPDLYEKIWSITLFDPKEPDSGWGTRVHKTIFPLTGKNVEIVPQGSKGYLMDSTCNANSWGGNSFSFTKFGAKYLEQGKFGKAFVYCYVSGDFNGNWVLLSVESRKGFLESNYYDLNKTDTWQKLEVRVKKNKDNLTLNMYFSKMGVTNFSTLKGYVIFACPQFKTSEKEDSLSVTNDSSENYSKYFLMGNDILSPYGSIFYNKSKIQNRSKTKLICDFFPKDSSGILFKNNGVTELFQSGTGNKTAGVFNLNIHSLNAMVSSNNDQDPIRKWISKLISEDTVYHPYKANISVDTVSTNFIDLRISHWKFALQIYSTEYNWPKKLFGGGFNFLNWYGYYFMKDKTVSDWPHNPFLSILLYSGICGLIIYCFFIYKVFYYYLKYKKEYPMLFIFFLVTFFFTFFSGGSPFDPPIMGFFVILPFFIHSIHKKDNNELDKKKD